MYPGATRDGWGEHAPTEIKKSTGRCPRQDHLRALSAVRAELTRLEEAICGGHHPVSDATSRVARAVATDTAKTFDTARHVQIPAWLRVTPGENRWPVAAALVVAIGLQLALPDRLALQSRWLLPAPGVGHADRLDHR